MIKPTVGRVVYFYDNSNPNPQAAIIAAVHTDTCINAAIFDSNGIPLTYPPRSIRLVQPGEERPPEGPFCEWMPYQVKKPTGSESGEKAAGNQTI